MADASGTPTPRRPGLLDSQLAMPSRVDEITDRLITAIAIGGQATGLTTGAFRVPAGQSITLTYSVAPTWVWFGD